MYCSGGIRNALNLWDSILIGPCYLRDRCRALNFTWPHVIFFACRGWTASQLQRDGRRGQVGAPVPGGPAVISTVSDDSFQQLQPGEVVDCTISSVFGVGRITTLLSKSGMHLQLLSAGRALISAVVKHAKSLPCLECKKICL